MQMTKKVKNFEKKQDALLHPACNDFISRRFLVSNML